MEPSIEQIARDLVASFAAWCAVTDEAADEGVSFENLYDDVETLKHWLIREQEHNSNNRDTSKHSNLLATAEAVINGNRIAGDEVGLAYAEGFRDGLKRADFKVGDTGGRCPICDHMVIIDNVMEAPGPKKRRDTSERASLETCGECGAGADEKHRIACPSNKRNGDAK